MASLRPFRQRLSLSGIFFLPDLIGHCICFFLESIILEHDRNAKFQTVFNKLGIVCPETEKQVNKLPDSSQCIPPDAEVPPRIDA
jgi:hypothetical protein